MIKGILLVLALTVVGAAIGMAVAIGIWEFNNPGHAAETGAIGGMWGLMLGIPSGGTIGFIVGTILAIRWSRPPTKKS